MSFTIDKKKCTFKLYKYVDTKVKITKYTLHQEYEYGNELRDTIVCETEMYATILTVLKDILQQQLRYIENLQRI